MSNSRNPTYKSNYVLAFFCTLFYSLIVVEWDYVEEGNHLGLPVLAAGYAVGVVYNLIHIRTTRPPIIILAYTYALLVITSCIFNDNSADQLANIIKNTAWIIALDVSYIYGNHNGDNRNEIKIACYIALPIMLILNILNLKNTFFRGDEAGYRDAVFPIIIIAPYLLYLKRDFVKTACFIFILLLTFISTKRSALISLFFAYASYYSIQFKTQKKQTGKFAILIFLIITVASVYYISNSKFGDVAIQRLEQIGEGDSSGRDEIYGPLLKAWEKSDLDTYLIGHGTLATVKVVDKRAHNDFLQVAFDYGLLPLVLFCIIYISLISYAFKINIKNKWRENDRVIYVFNLWIFILVGLFNCYISVPQMFAITISIFGYLIGRNKIPQRPIITY